MKKRTKLGILICALMFFVAGSIIIVPFCFSDDISLKADAKFEIYSDFWLAFFKNDERFFRIRGGGTGRGINIAVIHQATGEIEGAKNFDNWYAPGHANAAICEFIDNIPDGRIVMVGTADHGAYIYEETYQKFESIGSQYVRNINSWDEWVMITKKDASPSIAETHVPHGDTSPCIAEAIIELEQTTDLTPPQGSFSINSGADITDNPEVELDLSGIIDLGSGMEYGSRMRFSNDGVCWTTPEYFKPVKKWYLIRENGPKTVYAKFADRDGNWNQVPKICQINLDDNNKIVELSNDYNGRNEVVQDNNDNIYAVWSRTENYPLDMHICFTCSNNAGLSWTNPVDISAGLVGYVPDLPKISCDTNGNVYAVWHANAEDEPKHIYFNYSADYGQTWLTQPIRLDSNVSADLHSACPIVVNDNYGKVYVCWVEYPTAGYRSEKDIYFNYSADYGQTWLETSVKVNADTIIEHDNVQDLFKMVCDENGYIYLIWVGKYSEETSNNIYFNYSNDYGQTWQSSDRRINAVSNLWDYTMPKLKYFDNNLFVAWNGTTDIYFQHSPDKGVTWLENEILVMNIVETHFCMENDNNGNIYIAGMDEEYWHTYPKRKEIYFTKSSNYGQTWLTEPIRITTGPVEITSARKPKLTCDNNGGVYIAWLDDRNFHLNNDFIEGYLTYYRHYRTNVYLNYSKDYGQTWLENDIRLNKRYNNLYDIRDYLNIQCDDYDSIIYAIWRNQTHVGLQSLQCDTRYTDYILHLGLDDEADIFPQETAERSYYTGSASSLMILKYLNSTYLQNQDYIYSTYHMGSPATEMTHLELALAMNAEAPSPYHFSRFTDADQNMAIKRFAHWIDYKVPGVEKPNTPALVPTNGAYNWKVVRGIATNMDPCNQSDVFNIPNFQLSGLWLNDPKADGLGFNIYQTAEDFASIYQSVGGSYISVVEPPKDIDLKKLDLALKNAKLTIAKEKPINKLSSLNNLKNIDWKKVIPVELKQDKVFMKKFSKAKLSKTLNITDIDTNRDYLLALFSKNRRSPLISTALIIDPVTGVFKQASWADECVKYPKLSRRQACRIARKALLKRYGKRLRIKPVKISNVWSKQFNTSKFEPSYSVTLGAKYRIRRKVYKMNIIVYVHQDGTCKVAKLSKA